MGGVIRPTKAARVFVGNNEQTSLYMLGDKIWGYPELSTYRYPFIDTNDDVLMVGSSTLAGLTANLWSTFTPPTQHHWFPAFRADYSGSFSTDIDDVTLPGTGSANTLGRQPVHAIVRNAENNAYPVAVNPLVSMGNYDILIIDASDFMDFDTNHPIPHIGYCRVPYPYDWYRNPCHMNAEFEARMRLIRLAHANGVKRVFMSIPWSRFLETTNDSRDAEWRANCFDNVKEAMYWQQDRLNYQIKREGLGSYVSIIPFLDLIQRIYDDIGNGTAPAGLTHFRQISSNLDQTGDPLVPETPKHGYMLNIYGTYATNCLYATCVYGRDLSTVSNTVNGITVPLDIANYFKGIATEIGMTEPRAGHAGGPTTYAVPRISEGSPSDFVAPSKLVLHQDTAMTSASPASVFPQAATVATMLAAFSYNAANIGTEDQMIFTCRSNNNNDDSYLRMRIVDGIAAFSTGNVTNVWTSSQVILTTSGLVTRGNGTDVIVVDIKLPLNTVDEFNHNNSIKVIDTEADLYDPWADPQRYYVVGHTATPMPVVTHRLLVPTVGVTLHDALICTALLTDKEKFNYYRYLSKKLQVPVWEGLYPDMIE